MDGWSAAHWTLLYIRINNLSTIVIIIIIIMILIENEFCIARPLCRPSQIPIEIIIFFLLTSHAWLVVFSIAPSKAFILIIGLLALLFSPLHLLPPVHIPLAIVLVRRRPGHRRTIDDAHCGKEQLDIFALRLHAVQANLGSEADDLSMELAVAVDEECG